MNTFRLLFNDAMARAIVEGRKTVTRRPVMPQPAEWPSTGEGLWRGGRRFPHEGGPDPLAPCVPGNLLIGRECWRPVMEAWRSFVEYRAGGVLDVDGRALFVAERGIALRFPGAWKDIHTEKWRPSIHMPDWAARIRRRVVSVTVERLQDISEADAALEGFEADEELARSSGNHVAMWAKSARWKFAQAWDAIYATKGLGWAVNPWVWRIEFAGENERGPTP